MKRFLKSIAVLSLVLGLFTLNSCKKETAPDLSTKKIEFGFNVQIPTEDAGKKVESTDPYYGSANCDYTDASQININYKVIQAGTVIQEVEDLKLKIQAKFDEGVATELIQVEITDENLDDVTVSVTKFQVLNSSGEAIMATPNFESAYDGYVETELPHSFKVTQFQKEYTLMDVLCFQPDDYLEFGFTWFDFNIIEGEVISVFFNCINENDRENYHEVLPVRVNAYEGSVTSVDPYFFDYNYEDGVPLGKPQPINIPVPGAFYDVKTSTDVVMTLGILPLGESASAEKMIVLTKEDIDQWVNESNDPDAWVNSNVATYRYSDGIRDQKEEGDTYDYEFISGDEKVVDGETIIERAIHFQFTECFKPKKFLSNNVDGKCTVYAVHDNESTVELVKMFKIPETNFDGHIAVTPDKRELVIINSGAPTKLYKYDLYSLEVTEYLNPTGAPADENGVPYSFSQLTYGKNENGIDQLFAACMANQCLTLIGVDLDDPNEQFTFDADFVLDNNTDNYIWDADVEGGDIILNSNGSLFGFSTGGRSVTYNRWDWNELKFIEYDAEFEPNKGHFISYKNINAANQSASVVVENFYDDLEGVTGAMVSNNHIITSHQSGSLTRWDLEKGRDVESFWSWLTGSAPLSIPQEYKLTNPSTLTIIGDDAPTTLSSGDMASIYTLELP